MTPNQQAIDAILKRANEVETEARQVREQMADTRNRMDRLQTMIDQESDGFDAASRHAEKLNNDAQVLRAIAETLGANE